MDLVEIERAVAKVQGQLFERANHDSIGFFKSRFRGSGIQFKEHQIYNPGDDVRFIDWKLSAKSVDKTFVKTFEEERNVEVISVIDFSSTMKMGFNEKSKLQATIEIIALIYLITEKTKDFQKVILFEDKIVSLPRLSGRYGISLLLSHLKKNSLMSKNKDFNEAKRKRELNHLKTLIAKKKQVFLFTDFGCPFPKVEFGKLIKNRNFHCFSLRTPLDKAISRPFSFKSKSQGKTSFISNLKSQGEKEDIKNKSLNLLDLDKDYLEDFILSMRK